MILTTLDLKETYKDYADVNGKIKRDMDQGKLFPLVRGIYETNPKADGYWVAAYIYGPSYLSFEYALSFHHMIPERVVVYTNATFNKRKRKSYHNHFGHFTYHDVPKAAFPHRVKAYEEAGYAYFIARPEKALCDLLYIKPPVSSMKAFKALLLEDLRVPIDRLNALSAEDIVFLSAKYVSKNVQYLKKYMEREFLL